MGKLKKVDLIKKISKKTNLKHEVIKDVLDAFQDIFTEEVVLNGSFYLARCFQVSSSPRKARRAFNVSTGKFCDYPETNVLSIKLSKDINYLYRWSQRHANNEKQGISVEEFKEKIRNSSAEDLLEELNGKNK